MALTQRHRDWIANDPYTYQIRSRLAEHVLLSSERRRADAAEAKVRDLERLLHAAEMECTRLREGLHVHNPESLPLLTVPQQRELMRLQSELGRANQRCADAVEKAAQIEDVLKRFRAAFIRQCHKATEPLVRAAMLDAFNEVDRRIHHMSMAMAGVREAPPGSPASCESAKADLRPASRAGQLVDINDSAKVAEVPVACSLSDGDGVAEVRPRSRRSGAESPASLFEVSRGGLAGVLTPSRTPEERRRIGGRGLQYLVSSRELPEVLTARAQILGQSAGAIDQRPQQPAFSPPGLQQRETTPGHEHREEQQKSPRSTAARARIYFRSCDGTREVEDQELRGMVRANLWEDKVFRDGRLDRICGRYPDPLKEGTRIQKWETG